MKKNLAVVLACLLPLYGARAQEDSVFDFHRSQIQEETPSEILAESFSGRVSGLDLIRIIGRLDEDNRPKSKKYNSENLIDAYTMALGDELHKDPFFYAWKKYDENEVVIKKESLSALWETLVPRWDIFQAIDRTATKVKKATTVETPQVYRTRVKINPEPSASGLLKARIRMRAENRHIDGIHIKVGVRGIEFGKTYSLEEYGKRATLGFGVVGDYDGKFSVKATLKFPFGFW